MNDIEALERFVLDNPDLEKLEDMLAQFNIFETLNIVDTEMRHSYVLAWLLDPNANHGLGGYFSKKFIKYLISNNKQSLGRSISLIDFEIFDLSSLEVRREWQHIDILMILEDEKYVIAIENKIGSSEHGDQLERYKKTIDNEFKDFKKIFVYLTPDESTPKDEENWITFNYKIIGDLLADIIKYKKGTINDHVLNFISHYKIILRRQIVGESEVERLCKQIYKKHKYALDLIFQHKPDLLKEISDHLESIIKKSHPKTISDSTSKSYIRFTTPTLDRFIPKISEGWTDSKRILLYEFVNSKDRLSLRLIMGPGNRDFRAKLLEFFRKDKGFFKRSKVELRQKWQTVYTKEFLREKDYEDTDILDIEEKITHRFNDFINNDLEKINKFFQEKWEE